VPKVSVVLPILFLICVAPVSARAQQQVAAVDPDAQAQTLKLLSIDELSNIAT
jgi:hypothetical protein